MGDRAGDLDRWRPFHLLTSACATSRAGRVHRDPERQPRPGATPATCAAPRSGSRRSSRSPNGRVVETDGHPAVLAEWLGADRGTDDPRVRPLRRAAAGRREAWTTPPFEPSVRDGRIYGRGATDDKGPVVVALETARRSRGDGALPLNVRFLFEGEEEIGSPSLRALPRRAPRRARRRPRRLCRRRDVARRASRRSRSRRRAWSASTSRSSGRATDLHSGRHGGAVLESESRARADIVASPARRRRPRRGGRLLRRRRGALGRRSRRARCGSRSTTRPTGSEIGAPLLHGEPVVLDPRAPLDAADARGERAPRRRRVHRHPGHARPRTSRAGSSPTRIRSASSPRSPRTSRSVAPAGGACLGRAAARRGAGVRDRERPSGRRRRARCAEHRLRARSRCWCGSAAPCRPRCCSSGTSA